MAILSNINGKFAVEDNGAIKFNNLTGTNNQVLIANTNSSPTWVDVSTIIGGPYLPLTGGTLAGAGNLVVGGILTVNGVTTLNAALTGTTASFNAGATNVVATFTSTDGIAGIALVDSSGNVELSASGNTFQVQPAGGVAALTVSSTNATFAGNVGIGVNSPAAKLTIGDPGGATTRSIQIEGNTSTSGMNGVIGYFANGLYISNNYYYNSAQVHPVSTLGQTNIACITGTTTGSNFIDLSVSDHTDSNNAPDIRMRIMDNGNVGIGTGTVLPSEILQTNKDSAGNIVGGYFTNSQANTGAESVSLAFGLNRSGGDFVRQVKAITFGAEQQWTGTPSTVDGYLSFSTLLDENVAERMRINSNGNVNLLNATATNSKHYGITNAAGTTGWTFGNGVIANSHQFVIYDNTAGSARMLINSSGNVGIGVTSPVTKLEIEPSTGNSSIKSGGLEMQSYSINNSWYAENLYYDGVWRLRSAGFATQMYMETGTISFKRVASGSAGASVSPETTMRLHSSGNIGINMTGTPSRKLQIEGGGTYPLSVNSTQRYLQEFKRSGVSEWWIAVDNGSFIIHENGVGDKITVASGGTLTAAGDLVAYSDERLKTNIKTLDGSRVLKMRGVSFEKEGKKGSGVIAQELEKVAPELVNNDNEYKGVAYGNLTGYLIEAIKELEARVKELENK